jgi:hypothetical protein
MTIKKINRSTVISVSCLLNLIFHKRLFLRTLWKQVCVDKQRTHYFLKIRMYINKGRMKSSNRSSFSKEFWKGWERRRFKISTSIISEIHSQMRVNFKKSMKKGCAGRRKENFWEYQTTFSIRVNLPKKTSNFS